MRFVTVASILLLSTDLRVSERAKVLEVLPLPSEPAVSEGDVEVFRKATDLINRMLDKMGDRYRSGTSGDESVVRAGVVTFHSDMKLRFWRIRGDIRTLDRDLLAR